MPGAGMLPFFDKLLELVFKSANLRSRVNRGMQH
jgi:hypothetical protein